MKTFVANILLAIFGCAVAVVFLEVALRLMPQGQSARWYDRPKFYYVPNESTSLQGLNYSAAKPTDRFRIAVVGDSFSFAPYMQFDDAFPMKLERMLDASRQRRAEVINYAVPAYSSTHELEPVKQALAEHADLVLLQITLNDPELKPYRPTGITVKQNPYGAYVEEDHGSWITKHSRLLSIIASRLHNSRSHKDYEQYLFNLYQDKRGMQKMREAIQRITTLCKEANVPFVAVVFPLFGTAIGPTYPFTPLHDKVHEMLNELGVPYLELKDIYAGIPPERLQVMPGEDFHPNEIGHRMAAENIYKWLVEKDLIPESLRLKHLFTQRDQILFKDELTLPGPQ